MSDKDMVLIVSSVVGKFILVLGIGHLVKVKTIQECLEILNPLGLSFLKFFNEMVTFLPAKVFVS